MDGCTVSLLHRLIVLYVEFNETVHPCNHETLKP